MQIYHKIIMLTKNDIKKSRRNKKDPIFTNEIVSKFWEIKNINN